MMGFFNGLLSRNKDEVVNCEKPELSSDAQYMQCLGQKLSVERKDIDAAYIVTKLDKILKNGNEDVSFKNEDVLRRTIDLASESFDEQDWESVKNFALIGLIADRNGTGTDIYTHDKFINTCIKIHSENKKYDELFSTATKYFEVAKRSSLRKEENKIIVEIVLGAVEVACRSNDCDNDLIFDTMKTLYDNRGTIFYDSNCNIGKAVLNKLPEFSKALGFVDIADGLIYKSDADKELDFKVNKFAMLNSGTNTEVNSEAQNKIALISKLG